MNDVTKDLLEALKGLLVRVADDEEYGPDHAVTVARAAIARAEAVLAEPKPDADGWIPWAGGECPVEDGVLVDVRFRDGDELRHVEANVCTDSPRCAAFAYWRNDGMDNDIIAYRVVKP